MMKIDKVLNQIQEDKIEYILAQFVDIHGSPKVKMVPVNHINDLVDGGAGFAGLVGLCVLFSLLTGK